MAKVPSLEIERHIHQADEYRHLYQRANDRGEGLTRSDAEHCYCHGNGQLEVVAGRSEGNACRLGIASTDPLLCS